MSVTYRGMSVQAQFQALADAIEGIPNDPPKNLLEAMHAQPPVGTLPAPRATWLSVSLFDYREQQKLAKELVRKQMSEAIPPSERLCDLDQPVEMDLPGSSEWKVTLECENGWGILINRTTREMITFGLTRKDREVIVFLDDFHNFVKPASRLEPAGRALELNFPNGEIWQSVDDLVAARLVDGIDYDGSLHEPWLEPPGYCLNRHLAAEHAAGMLRFCQQWEDANRRLWLAAVIGDWGLAHELAQATHNAKLIAYTGERAEQCRTVCRGG